jgi:hypothetical protein
MLCRSVWCRRWWFGSHDEDPFTIIIKAHQIRNTLLSQHRDISNIHYHNSSLIITLPLPLPFSPPYIYAPPQNGIHLLGVTVLVSLCHSVDMGHHWFIHVKNIAIDCFSCNFFSPNSLEY